jgi:succinate dehydrogenase/fumarate reductase flavoprotein subunit
MTFDVIIVGGGGSGLAAAVSAAEHGCSVVLLEKQPELGGTTGIAVGSFTANSTAFQARAGIKDNHDDHAVDAAKFAAPEIEACNNNELRTFLLQNAADTLGWLTDMGLNFHGPSPEPPNRVPRMHNVVPGAKAYIATLQSRLLRLGGTILCNADVRGLIQKEEGITGVEAVIDQNATTLSANRGVILAAGDYANSPELIARFKGDRFAKVEGINPRATGDGHRLAEQAGAKLINMDITYGPELRFVPPPGRTFQQLLPTHGFFAKLMGVLLPLVPNFVLQAMIRRLLVTWQHPEDSLFDDGAILINSKGERFCDETEPNDRELAIADQADKQAYILLDEKLIQRYAEWPHFISTAPKIAYAYVSDYLRLRPDVAIAGDSLEQLARARGIPTDALIRTVETYNNGERDDRPALEGNRWCLLGPAKAYFTTTEGGAAIDLSFRVLDEEGIPIPGLYAIGQNGLGGQILWGHGLHIAWAITSGRLCGIELAKE